MPSTKPFVKRRWKRRCLWTGWVLVLVTGIVVVLAFTRIHFPHQEFPRLAKLQRHSSEQLNHDRQPLIIGHRGSGLSSRDDDSLTIGNTATAIQRGIDAGADWIEIDIQQTVDGHLVVFHDADVARKTNGQGNVEEFTLQELQTLKISVEPAEQILTLDEVFDRFHSPEQKWILDLKTPGMQQTVLAWLESRFNDGLSREQVVLFGRPEVLRDYAESGYKLGCIASWEENRVRVFLRPSKIIPDRNDVPYDYLVLPVSLVNRSRVEQAKRKGYRAVWCYGSDHADDWKYAVRCGIAGLIVDFPQRAREQFQE